MTCSAASPAAPAPRAPAVFIRIRPSDRAASATRRELTDDKLRDVNGSAGTSNTGTGHPNPPIGPGG